MPVKDGQHRISTIGILEKDVLDVDHMSLLWGSKLAQSKLYLGFLQRTDLCENLKEQQNWWITAYGVLDIINEKMMV